MLQGFYEEKSAQQYPIGLRVARDDRVFRYCKAEANPGGTSPTIRRNRGVVFTQKPVLATGVVAALAGATQITCTVAGVADGDYDEGYIIQQPTVNWDGNSVLRIRRNADGVYYLKDPLAYPIATTDNLFFNKNIYAQVGKTPTNHQDKEYRAIVAVPLIHVTPEYYFWGQTWGPCCLQFGNGSAKPGQKPSARSLWFDYYGAVLTWGGTGSGIDGQVLQYAGFCLPDTFGSDSMLCMLQISP